jgi:FtsP/CotA-like multicopper oxidase with cupredoxin domain
MRTLWGSHGVPSAGSKTDTRCASQDIRYFDGYNLSDPKPWPTGPEPLPGPTLRARVGDTVEVMFLNQINMQHFANTLDQGEQGKTPGCDEVFASTPSANWKANTAYKVGDRITPSANNPGGYSFRVRQSGTSGATAPTFPQAQRQTVTDGTVIWANTGNGPGTSTQIYPNGGRLPDLMPNCLHGSSTANLHFHGTHTTPNTTGDNVLLFVHPALRVNGQIEPSDSYVKSEFAKIFAACERNGTPTQWSDLPLSWRQNQEKLLKFYDTTTPYKGVAGRPGHPALPHDMQLWPQNESEIKDGLWPQFQMGAFPYCFKLPAYDPAKVVMGQAPGTHWYHAHKHGSTALNVANGMTGIFIIEGKYDDDLHKFYGPNLREKVMMLQQLSSAPFPVLDPSLSIAPGGSRAPISINGRRNPVVTMNPGEVQLWRIVNGAFRDAVQFLNFTEQGAQQPCSKNGPCVDWRQIAQDGVQLKWQTYNSFGAMDNQLNLAPANRADLLVRAPSKPGVYVLQASANEGFPIQEGTDTSYPFPLLTVKVVNGQSMGMNFIEKEQDFPTFPEFLKDIPETDIFNTRKVVFASNHKQIDGASFDPHKINQAVLLNTSEEWTVYNQANDKAHPFHIHVNPFQITSLFEPNSKESSDPKNPCYADPMKPETWKPCQPLNPPFVWWDTFAIPIGRQDTLPTNVCTTLSACPAAIQPYTNCSNGKCTVTIAGYFKMRSRFVDFPGQFVLHCHILIHEDRGMMQMVSVCPNTTKYVHQ